MGGPSPITPLIILGVVGSLGVIPWSLFFLETILSKDYAYVIANQIITTPILLPITLLIALHFLQYDYNLCPSSSHDARYFIHQFDDCDDSPPNDIEVYNESSSHNFKWGLLAMLLLYFFLLPLA